MSMKPRRNYGSKRVPKKDLRSALTSIVTTRLSLGPEFTEADIESIARSHGATVAEVQAMIEGERLRRAAS